MGIIQNRIEEQLVNIIESYHNKFGGNMEEDILGYVPENVREQYRVALHRFEHNEEIYNIFIAFSFIKEKRLLLSTYNIKNYDI